MHSVKQVERLRAPHSGVSPTLAPGSPPPQPSPLPASVGRTWKAHAHLDLVQLEDQVLHLRLSHGIALRSSKGSEVRGYIPSWRMTHPPHLPPTTTEYGTEGKGRRHHCRARPCRPPV